MPIQVITSLLLSESNVETVWSLLDDHAYSLPSSSTPDDRAPIYMIVEIICILINAPNIYLDDHAPDILKKI